MSRIGIGGAGLRVGRQRIRRAVVIGLGSAVATLSTGCSSTEPIRADGVPDVGVVHVHGLGVDPADGALYAATHSGLFRIDGDGSAERVGEHWHDLMGFTVVGPNRFVASGHPDLRTDLPPLLGLVESDDGGETWVSRSLLGEADFHALEAVGDRVYAYDGTTGRLMTTSDGERWNRRSRVASVIDIAVSPVDPEEVLVTTGSGTLRSDDGGRIWEQLHGPPAAAFVAWGTEHAWIVSSDGEVSSSRDAGDTWRSVGTIDGGPPEAFTLSDGELYVATPGRILRSGDGENWELVYER